ncbi:hypothetical protein E2C01_085484 [Portunus trituberculatus]|uniref:Uncharacterized protein n=1 Tax=Portunus trituberculatus TaxID=210409 RepID=A0A5B7J6Y4_PORTR|nr:hypothetical protein [Portunus trituberculatus]
MGFLAPAALMTRTHTRLACRPYCSSSPPLMFTPYCAPGGRHDPASRPPLGLPLVLGLLALHISIHFFPGL